MVILLWQLLIYVSIIGFGLSKGKEGATCASVIWALFCMTFVLTPEFVLFQLIHILIAFSIGFIIGIIRDQIVLWFHK